MTYWRKKNFSDFFIFFVLDVIWDRLGYEKPSSGSGLQSFNNGLVMFYDLKSNFHEILFKKKFDKKWPKVRKNIKCWKIENWGLGVSYRHSGVRNGSSTS